MNFNIGNKIIYLGDSEENAMAKITWEDLGNGIINVNHTIVDESLQGKGIAGKLFDRLISYAKENNLKIKATCSYVVKKLETGKYKDIQAL